VYVCLCARVRASELRRVIRDGAATEDAVGDACGAGTRCGTCLDRIAQVIDQETATAPARWHVLARQPHPA
jgi:bacterioferritin-associated ferredoxin